MQLPSWSRSLIKRYQRHRERVARRELFAPVRLSLRRLEERRVLDVSAAFASMDGILVVDIENAGEMATISDSSGDLSIKDSMTSSVDIKVDGVSGTVALADIKEVIIRGDANADQEVVFDTSLSLDSSLLVEADVETARLGGNITSGSTIDFGSDVILNNNVTLVGSNVTFAGTVDSQTNATRSLTIDAGVGVASFSGDIGAGVVLNGLDIQRADAGVAFNLQTIHSTNTVSIGSNNVIGGSGVVFDAGNGNTLSIETTNDDVTVNGTTELRSSLLIDTEFRGGGGDIIFTDIATIDSEVGETNSLTLDAGEGSVFVNRDVGANAALGRFDVLRADGGVAIGDTSDVNLLRADTGINIGGGSNHIVGGITLNGGASTLVLQTSGTDIRLNGATTLASDVLFDTGAGNGNVLLTNDTPVDSELNEFNDLTFDVGAGMVFVNEDLGRTNAIGSLRIISAGGGVVFGQETTEVPGAGSRGPVEVINADNGIDIGVGTSTIGGEGIVFRGSASAGLAVTTTNDAVRINGATTLGTDVSFNTSGGNLTFTSNSSVDGVTGTTSSLSIDLGDGSLFFNADLGRNTALGTLSVVSASGGVTFGDTAPVTLVRTQQPIDIGVSANVINGGITLNGGNSELLLETENANVRLNGAITAESDIAIDTGDGNGSILLTGNATLNSASGGTSNVRLDAGNGRVSINANIGEQELVGTLNIERAAAGVNIGGADAITPNGTGPVTQMSTDGVIAIGSVEAISGGIALNGGGNVLAINTTADDINLNGPIELQSDVAINTGSGAGDVNLSATTTVNSQAGEANDLALTLDIGSALFNAAIGVASPLGELRIVSATDVTAQAAINAGRVVQEAGSGTTTFASTINTSDAAAIGVDLMGTEFVFHDSITATGDGRVSIVHSGLLDINPAASLQLEGAFDESGAGSTELAANITTTGDAIHFGSPLVLTDAANVTLDTTATGNATGAAITFDQAVNATTASVESLTLNAGSSGDVLFSGAVGDANRLGQIEVIEANDLTLADSLTTTNIVQTVGNGTTTFSGTVDTNALNNKGIDINATDIAFENAVTTTGDGRVELTASGTLDLAAAADMDLTGSFSQDGGGSVVTSADITTDNADITFADDVRLRQSVRFDTGVGAGDLTFGMTLDGTTDCQEDLTLAVGTGNAIFRDAVGNTSGLGALQIDDVANVRFHSSLRVASLTQTTGSGETRFDGAVTVKEANGIDLTTTSVTINDSFDTSTASGPISIVTTGDIAVNAAITSGTALVGLTAGDDVLFGVNGSVVTTGPNVNISATNDIRLGRIQATTLVRLTSTNGSIIDGGDVGGPDVVADELALRSNSGVGTANPLDISVNTIAGLNKQAGGIRVENTNGGTLTIGDVDGLTGIVNGPTASPAKLEGEVEIIHVGAIDVVSPILNDGGDHTIVRAELPGDLTIDAPIQNRGGNGWLFLFSGGDLTINDSLPEPQAEISVENEGAIRGEARGSVLIDNSDTDYVIVRTHSERFPNADPLPTLSAKFLDPARYPDPTDTVFYTELETELQAIRNSISGQATNFAPLFDIEAVDQGGSDVDSNGRGIVKITIGDAVHLETNWHFTIDWGDGTIENYSVPGNPQASLGFLTSQTDLNTNRFPDLSATPRLDSGVNGEPGVYYVHHRYLSPPNPDDPAQPVPISAELRYDAREEGEQVLDLNRPNDGSAIFNGIRFFQNGSEALMSTDVDELTVPGEGQFFAIKIIESVIIPVGSRETTTVFFATTTTTSTVTASSSFEFVAASFEAETFEEYRLFLRVVDDVAARAEQGQRDLRSPTAGEGEEEFPLSLELLSDPVQLFRDRQFPNGHYRIYLEEVRTGRIRLILDVHIYEGRVVPENFREGAAERQPGTDDSSMTESSTDPLVMQQDIEAKATANAAVLTDAERLGMLPVEVTENANANSHVERSQLRRSAMLCPVVASTLPWRTRVKRVLESETRPITRTSLRLRNRPRV